MMKKKMTKSGMTLTELLTVMAIMALLIGIAVPAARAILDSFETSAGVTNVISAALANARAIALKNSRYTGVRFQQDLRGNQYMIFIVHDPALSPSALELQNDPTLTGTNRANGFRAVKGRKPMKLPSSVGLMDLTIVNRAPGGLNNLTQIAEEDIDENALIDEQYELNDTTTFSIVFSPSGKLITHRVWARNRHGRDDDSSNDQVFNTINNIVGYGIGMFIEDDSGFWVDGFGPEFSRRGFIIYNKNDFNRISPNRRWSGYLRYLERLYVNPHSGKIIN